MCYKVGPVLDAISHSKFPTTVFLGIINLFMPHSNKILAIQQVPLENLLDHNSFYLMDHFVWELTKVDLYLVGSLEFS